MSFVRANSDTDIDLCHSLGTKAMHKLASPGQD